MLTHFPPHPFNVLPELFQIQATTLIRGGRWLKQFLWNWMTHSMAVLTKVWHLKHVSTHFVWDCSCHHLSNTSSHYTFLVISLNVFSSQISETDVLFFKTSLCLREYRHVTSTIWHGKQDKNTMRMFQIHTGMHIYAQIECRGQFNKAFTSVFYKWDQFVHTLKHTSV